MALTLTQTAHLTKKVLLYFLIGLFVIIVGIIGYQLWYYQWYLPHKPPPQIKPEVTFGVLPSPKFNSTSTTSSNYSYSLATTTGGLPSFSKIAKVYFIPQLGTTFLAPDKAKNTAASFGFSNGPNIINQTQYQFTDTSNSQFAVDLDSGKFSFFREASSSALPKLDTLPDQGKIVADFKTYLDKRGFLNDDLKSGRSKVTYDTPLPKDAQTATVSIWPKDFDSMEIVTPSYNTGLIEAIVNKLQDDNIKYTALDYVYWNPDPTHSATYPLKSAETAFSELKNGFGSVVIEPNSPQVNITSVKLSYFESDNYFPYLIPIYVFEGDGFVAYVNAITSEWLLSK